MNRQRIKLGELDCVVVDALPAGREPSLHVVLCHGFGAPGEDLVPLGSELVLLKPALADAVRFYFPAAPMALDAHGLPGGRAWWMVDVAALAGAVERGELRAALDDTAQKLPPARQAFEAALDDLRRLSGVGPERWVLGGFSQGSMVATDAALRLAERPAGLCVWSGTLLSERQWRPLAQRRGPMPVVQSHGREDPILPFQGALWLRDMLVEAGLPVEFIEFHGGHAIPPNVLTRTAAMLERAARLV